MKNEERHNPIEGIKENEEEMSETHGSDRASGPGKEVSILKKPTKVRKLLKKMYLFWGYFF